MGRIVYDMPEATYHANCGDHSVPLFSSTIAKILASSSPLHAYAAHPSLGADAPESTDAMDEGSIFDALITGQADKVAVTEDHEEFRSNAAKEWRDARIAEGRVPLVAKKFAKYANAAAKARHNLDRVGFVFDGVWQPAILFTLHASNGNPVACKARLDHLRVANGEIYDLKKVAKGANPKGPWLPGYLYAYGYDIQAAMYPVAVEAAFPDLVGRSRFWWALIEAGKPYAASKCEPSGTMRAVGAARLQAALDTWERCLRIDTWPGYEGEHRIAATSRMLEDAMVEEGIDENI